MFIHWGLYSIPGRGEWLLYQENIPLEEYSRLADEFVPEAYDPDLWVATARDAGMKYMVLTTRHHDGFCLFDSGASDFTAPKSACGRDLIAEFAEACHRADMPLGLYYSLVDWRFPKVLPQHLVQADDTYTEMIEQAHAQVRELCTNYGKVDVLWYDMLRPHDRDLWRSEELNAMARRLQPDIVINNRAGPDEDFGTPENVIVPGARAWEACYTMNDTWGYAKYDRNYKTPMEIIRLLASCVAQDGNFLLNVGPEPDGRFPEAAVERLQAVGRWMRVNGEAIYGAGSSAVGAPAVAWSTGVGNTVYMLVERWPGSTLAFAWCGSKVVSAEMLADGRTARIEQEGDRVWLHGLPDEPPDPYMDVVKVTFDGRPQPSSPPYG